MTKLTISDIDKLQGIIDNFVDRAQEEVRILRELKRATEDLDKKRSKLNQENGSERVN